MVKLNPELFLAQGAHKKCYIHPHDNNLCIKLPKKNHIQDVVKEVNYCKHINKTNSGKNFISSYKGTIETNLGKGYVFELVKNYDGTISNSLEFYLKNLNKYIKKIPYFRQAFLEMKESLIKENIITRNLKERNILVQKISKDKIKFVIIDDIGPTEFIPLVLYFRPLAQNKILRKISRFKNNLTAKYEKLKDYPADSRY